MKKLLLMALLIPAMFSLQACGFQTIDQGNTGVKKTLGKVNDYAYEPGFYLFNPFTSSFIEMDNHEQKWEGETSTYTKDVQQAEIHFTVTYALAADHSIEMYSKVGKDWPNILLPQAVYGELKNTIGQWNATDLVSNREKATMAIHEAISRSMAARGVAITSFQLTNVDFQPEFEKSVEDKVIEIQKAQASVNKTVQIQEQAKQTLITANADAESMRIKSDALAKSQSLVSYEAVKKWDGKMPTIMLGSGQNTILPLNEILKGQ